MQQFNASFLKSSVTVCNLLHKAASLAHPCLTSVDTERGSGVWSALCLSAHPVIHFHLLFSSQLGLAIFHPLKRSVVAL